MDMIPLKAAARDPKTKNKKMRRDGQVPCVVYGFEVKDLVVQCNERELHKAFAQAGESTIVELDVAGKKVPVLFKEVQLDPISDREIHADFYAVNMKKEIETDVPLHVEGESLAVKDLGGVLVMSRNRVRVRCLPADLPQSLTVNIASLAEFHDSVAAKDLKVPKGVQLMEDAETVLVTVQEPRKEEVITPVVTATAEGAVPADGTAAAPGAPGAPGAPAAAGAPGAPAAAAPAGKEKK